MEEEEEYVTGSSLLGNIGFIYTNKREIPMHHRYLKEFVDEFLMKDYREKVYIKYHEDGLEPSIEVLNE